jgi:TnpA family transposase
VDLDAWRAAYEQSEAPWLMVNLIRPQSKAWRGLLDDPNRRRAFCAAEALLLWELRQALRGGRLHVPHSMAHRSVSAMLKREDTSVRAANTTKPPQEFLDTVLRDLKEALECLAQAVEQGRVRIDGRNLHLKALSAEDTLPGFKALREELYGELPSVHLPEVLLKIDAQVHFSSILLGHTPRTELELVYLYTALLGHAMDLSPPRLAMMVAGLQVSGIAEALRVLEDGKALRRANDAVVEFLREHSIAAHWGRGVDCASDAMSLDVSRSISTARLDPRRKQWGTAVYGHVLGHYGIGHDMPLPVLARQDGAAIEGALRMRTVVVERVMTDTHGQSAMGFAIGKLCGLDLCPRIKSVHDRRLHVPRGFAVPEALDSLCIPDILMQEIEQGYPELAALADAVAAGKLSAVIACQRHGTAARPRKAYKAGLGLGLLLRTIHLCETATNDPFRRETGRLLNHGELVHALQRQIRRAGFGTHRGMRQEELIAQSGSLTLITNVVLAHNTRELQGVVDRWERAGRRVSSEVLRHLSPTPFARLNFLGTLSFPVHQYRNQLLEPRRAERLGTHR